jgi:two-component system, sensor histidine kinase
VVALSGFGQRSDRERAVRAGFDHHLAKPASADDLQRLLDETSASRPRGQTVRSDDCAAAHR